MVSSGGTGFHSTSSVMEREARIVGIRGFTTPTLEAVDRRRSQLWTISFSALVCMSAAVALLTNKRVRELGFASGTGFRIGTILLVVGLAVYVIEKERHLRRLAKLLTNERVLAAALSNRLKELAVLYEAGKAMNSVLVVSDVLDLILASALELLEASSGSILLVEDRGLTVVCQAGERAAPLEELETDMARRVMNEHEPLLMQLTIPGRPEAESAVCVPLVHRAELLGVLMVTGDSGHVYSEHDLRAVSLFAEHAAVSVANARLYEAEKELSARLETRVELSLAEIQAREARFSALVQNSTDLVTIVDRDGRILFHSPSVSRILGWDRQGTLGASLLAEVHPSDQLRWPSVVEVLQDEPGGGMLVEWRVRHTDGSWRFLQSVVTNLSSDPSVGGWVLNSRDVTDQKALEEQLRHQAFHDPLTGLANRALFGEQLGQALRRRGRLGGGLALLFMDLDGFKAVNDLHGHALGDEVLRQAADRLRNTVRDADAIARLGGDEFAVLFEGVPLESYPRSAAERLIGAFAKPFRVGSSEVIVTASLGVAIDETGTEGADELLRNADLAMYAAKTKNKGGFEVFSPGMHSMILDRMQVELDLRSAVEQNQFEIHYQPIADYETGVISEVEALIRWNHPRRGLLMPAEFVALAESSGIIIEVGNWILHHACQEFQAVTTQVPGGERLGLSINLSSRQLGDPALVDTVRGVLLNAGLAPTRLTLEITESTVMADVENTIPLLNELRSLGVKVAIDDFGTGYSSLSLLAQIPVDTLKIDKTFVSDIGTRPEPARLVRAILLLASDFGLRTVAEGVEERDQFELLRDLGCQACQGLFLAPPLPARRIVPLLQEASQAAS